MTGRITIVDYGAGNIFSLSRALAHVGAAVELADTPDAILAAKALVLPGVGAFGDCVDELRARHLDGPVCAFASSGRPLLGICVGMQMLFEASEEFGNHAGLGLLAGKVCAIPAIDPIGGSRKVPHIGWAGISADGRAWTGSILDGLPSAEMLYFVHSFSAIPADRSIQLATATYDGYPICAAVLARNVSGCQFHPEKSGEAGLRILANFVALP